MFSFFFLQSNASQCQTILKICKEMELHSPCVPAELALFFSQHHKWSWSRSERRSVRPPLCADSIRNNCILATLHSPPLRPQQPPDISLYFCAVCCSMDVQLGEGHRSVVVHTHVIGLSPWSSAGMKNSLAPFSQKNPPPHLQRANTRPGWHHFLYNYTTRFKMQWLFLLYLVWCLDR